MLKRNFDPFKNKQRWKKWLVADSLLSQHCRIALYTSAVTIAAGHMGELEYPEHKGTRTSGTPRSTRISRTHRN